MVMNNQETQSNLYRENAALLKHNEQLQDELDRTKEAYSVHLSQSIDFMRGLGNFMEHLARVSGGAGNSRQQDVAALEDKYYALLLGDEVEAL